MAKELVMTFADQAGRTATQGPFAEIFLVGETMRASPGAPPFATHEEHHWCLAGGKRFFRAECAGPLTVRLRRLDGSASKTYGPFESASFVNGIAYVDRGVFAFVDRSIGDWYCHGDGRHWAVVVLSPA